MSARLPISSEPTLSPMPIAAAPSRVPQSNTVRASSTLPWRLMRCMEIAQRMASIRSPEKVSVQSAMRAPASRSSMMGAMRPPLALPIGAGATVILDLPIIQQAELVHELWRREAGARPNRLDFEGKLREMRMDVAAMGIGQLLDLAQQIVRTS